MLYSIFVVMLKHISTPDTLDVEKMDAIDTCLKSLVLEYYFILLLDLEVKRRISCTGSSSRIE